MDEKKEEEKMITIPEKSLEWLTIGGFIELYQTYIEPNSTYKSAYQAAEMDFQNAFKRRRYKDYQSFIQSKWRYQTKLLKEHKNQTK
jgi:hypothetical protein